MTSGENQPMRPILSTIRRTCPECGGEMSVELLRPDPHDTPVLFLVCPCGHWEKPAADIEAQLTRLNGMKGGSMKPELKKWLVQRLAILKQLKEKAA